MVVSGAGEPINGYAASDRMNTQYKWENGENRSTQE